MKLLPFISSSKYYKEAEYSPAGIMVAIKISLLQPHNASLYLDFCILEAKNKAAEK